MTSPNVYRIHRPLQGLVAFVPSFAAEATCVAHPFGSKQEQRERPSNPGEDNA